MLKPELAAFAASEKTIIPIVLRHGKRNGRDTDRCSDVSMTMFLSIDVTNPKPDRRSPKDWHKRPTFPRGKRFRAVVRNWKPDPDHSEARSWERSVEVAGGAELLGCYAVGDRHAMLHWSELDFEQRAAILTALSPALDETLPEAFDRITGAGAGDLESAKSFLVWAIENGEIGRAHAERMLDAFYFADEDSEPAVDQPACIDVDANDPNVTVEG